MYSAHNFILFFIVRQAQMINREVLEWRELQQQQQDQRLSQVLNRFPVLNITPNQIPPERHVNFVEEQAVFRLGDQIVINAGVNQPIRSGPLIAYTAGTQGQPVPVVPLLQADTNVITENPELPAYRMDRKPRGHFHLQQF